MKSQNVVTSQEKRAAVIITRQAVKYIHSFFTFMAALVTLLLSLSVDFLPD